MPDGCAPIDRLGPFDTEDEASHALEKAEQRNQEWDDDPQWNDSRGLTCARVAVARQQVSKWGFVGMGGLALRACSSTSARPASPRGG